MPTRAEVRKYVRHRNLAHKVRFNASPEATTQQENTTMVSTTEQKAPDARLVAPGILVLAANVRGDTIVDKAFISNVKQHGVIVPLIVEDAGNGTFNVIDGQHRAIAAVEAGLDLVPVIVQAAGDDVARIVEQLIVNDQRTQLTESERAGGYKQLSLIGISADQIARRTNAPKKRVELALVVAESPYATELASAGVTLEHAAAIIEFEDDPELAEQLASTAVNEPARFEHVAQQLRGEQKVRAARAELLAEFEAAGIQVIADQPGYADRFTVLAIDELYTDAELTNDLSTDSTTRPEQKIDGLTAWIDEDFVPTAPEPGENATDADWADYEASEEMQLIPVYYVRDWQQAGFFSSRHNYQPSAVPAATEAASSDDVAPSPEQVAADEKASAERRRVIKNNKAWPAAAGIRTTWIRDTLLAKIPDHSAAFVATYLSGDLPGHAGAYYGRNSATKWLDIKTEDSWAHSATGSYVEAHPNEGLRVALAIAVGAIEKQITNDKSAWRGFGGNDTRKTARYLTALAAWGYGLSDIEQELVDERGAKD